jgi:hypothetical protein
MRKRALLVGINDFHKNWITPLRGCVNDVIAVRSILKDFFGYTNSMIHCVTGYRATKQLVLTRLAYLVDWAQPGDHVTFLMSSHGSQIRDRHGDELKDRMDELVCPYDMDWEKGQFITDDEFYQVCGQFKPGVIFEAILDTCHSGTGMRDIGCKEATGEQRYRATKFLNPPIDIQARSEGEECGLGNRPLLTQIAPDSGNILWAACKSNQTSADAYFNGVYNGAFTYNFCKVIRQNKGKISRRALIYDIRRLLLDDDFDQIPQLECENDLLEKNVFSV